jgi:hypothetical protein
VGVVEVVEEGVVEVEVEEVVEATPPAGAQELAGRFRFRRT